MSTTPAPIWNERTRTTEYQAGRKCTAATSDVYGHVECAALQPGHSHVLPALGRGRKAQEGGAVCGSTEAVADRLGGGHARDQLRPDVWTTAAAGGCVRKREADAHPHRAGQDRARLVVCPETKGCSRRARSSWS